MIDRASFSNNNNKNMNELSAATAASAAAAMVAPEEKERAAKAHPSKQPFQTASQNHQTTMWQSNEWSYAAEGGKHALFRYSGTDSDFFGHLLRVAKIDLANASSSYHQKNDLDIDKSTGGGASSSASTTSASDVRTCRIIEFLNESADRSFHRTIVQPLIGHCYLDLARLVRLPASCCTQLYDRTVASGSIPPSRVPSWMAAEAKKIGGFESKKSKKLPESIKASLLRDHTFLAPHPCLQSVSPTSVLRKGIIEQRTVLNKHSKNDTILSVEIKPKAGYITTSPLVLPEHRCKYYRTRYAMHQELMSRGHVQKGWLRSLCGGTSTSSMKVDDTTSFTPSNYSPLDLFSGNNARIQKALHDLSQSMQNNFRVWCNGQQIFGEYTTASDIDCKNVLNNILQTNTNNYNANATNELEWTHPTSTLLDVITRAVSSILATKESALLSNLLKMQELDAIDGDGAIFIYQRLVGLCGGSHEVAQQALDDAALITKDGVLLGKKQQSEQYSSPAGRASDYLFASSPYEAPQHDEALDKLLDEIIQFQIYLHSASQDHSVGPTDENVMNASHVKCVGFVSQLSKESCIYLLQNWLLSLAVCDVSFFVTFRFLSEDELAAARVASTTSSSANTTSLDEGQTCHHGGIVLCSMQDDDGMIYDDDDDDGSQLLQQQQQATTTLAVHYEVKIIDCDPKPAKKLRNRGEDEGKFKLIGRYSH